MDSKLNIKIEDKISALRRRIKWYLLLNGLSLGLGAILLVVVLTFALDYGLYRLTLQHMTFAQRLVILLLCAVALSYGLWIKVIQPLKSPLTGRDLLMAIELKYPQLQDRWLTAYYFSNQHNPTHQYSHELLQKTYAEADLFEAQVDVRKLFSAGSLKITSMSLIGLLAVGVMLVISLGEFASIWYQRILLLGDAQWPRQTSLVIEVQGNRKVLRGSPISLSVLASSDGIVPEKVKLFMSLSDSEPIVETLTPERYQFNKFSKTIPSVTDSFSYWFTGNDDRTTVSQVIVCDPPGLKRLKIEAQPPRYTGLHAMTVDLQSTTIEIPDGSVLAVEGSARAALSVATLEFEGNTSEKRLFWTRAILLDADNTSFAENFVLFELQQSGSGILRIVLQDEHGFQGEAAKFLLKSIPDTAPRVHLEARDIGGTITTRAQLPLEMKAVDDYGIQSLTIQWAAVTANEPLRDLRQFVFQNPRQELHHKTVFDLESLHSSSLTESRIFHEGDSIRIQVSALDLKDLSGGPNRGSSNELIFKFVSEEELLGNLVDRQHSLQDQLKRVLLVHLEAMEKCGAAMQTGFRQDRAELLRNSGMLHEQASDRLKVLVESYRQLLETMLNNRVGHEADKNRLQRKIIQPLDDLMRREMLEISRRFLTLRSNEQGLENASTEAGEINRFQKGVQKALEAILGEISNVQNAQQVERELREILKTTEEVKRSLQQKKKE